MECEKANARLVRLVPHLAADFPAWDFATQQTRDGLALVAVRRHGADEAGVCAVITSDLGELRRTLGGAVD